MPDFGLPQRAVDTMRAIFAKHSGVKKVVIYGSRAMGNYRNGSDIDLTMFGDALEYEDVSRIAGDLDDSDIPYLVDLSIFDRLDHAKLKDHINRVGKVFYDRYAGWRTLSFEQCVSKNKTPLKLPKKEYLPDGAYPVVAQEANLINGYCNDAEMVCYVSTPVIIFGDHTRVLKLIEFDFVMGADGAKIIKPKDFIDAKYFFYYLKLLMPKNTGYARHYRFLKELTFHIPPLPEQKRIVAKLDAEFAEIDRAIAAAGKKSTETENMKASILSQQLDARSQGSGEEWRTVKLGDVSKFVRGLTYSKKDETAYSQTAVLRATNVDLSTYSLTFDKIRYISDDVKIKDEKYAKAGDILMCTASGSKSHLGKVAIVTTDTGMAFGGFMAALRTSESCLSSYLYLVLISPRFSTHLTTVSDGANINNLKFSQISNFELSLPPLPQQQRIVAKLDAAFKETDRMRQATTKQIANYRALKSALLVQELQNEVA